MLAELIDKALDWTVIPGYSRIGYSVRRRFWVRRDAERPMSGWTVLVTGAGSGIGSRAPRRSPAPAPTSTCSSATASAARTRARISERTGSDRLQLEVCDISSLDSVREFAAGFASASASSTCSSTTPG